LGQIQDVEPNSELTILLCLLRLLKEELKSGG